MNQKILEIEALRKYYGKRESQTKALDGITFQVVSGEFLGIMGSSGSGKSTLLNCIATVIAPRGAHCYERDGNYIFEREGTGGVQGQEGRLSVSEF